MKYFLSRIFYLWCIISISTQYIYAAEPPTPPALAVIVHAETGGEALAQPLEALLEVEVSRRYEGAMLERAELATVLQEMKLSSLLGDAKADKVQKGKVEGAACLVLARVSAKSVRVTATGFPKTDVIFEQEYSERLEAESLSERIAGDALSAIRNYSRDAATPHVAVGSFYVLDPHGRFLDFGRGSELELRRQVAQLAGVRMVERLFPSDLLNEFNLARAGMTVSKFTDFNAPPADVLVYGESVPQANQDLSNPGILLDCTVKVISPTGLFPRRSAKLSCRSNDIAPVVEKARTMLQEALPLARAALAKPDARGFSTSEFEAFKQQAFRLMPTPPREGGVFFFGKLGQMEYRQKGTREELERALRMLECAALFNGSDSTVLINTALVLQGIADYTDSPPAVKTTLQDAAMELVNRAYRLESTSNTRCFYSNFGFSSRRPNVVLSVSRHIWNTRETEEWWASTVDIAHNRLVEFESGPGKKLQFLFEASALYEQRPQGLATLRDLVFKSVSPVNELGVKTNPPAFDDSIKVADGLIAGESLFLQACGHLIRASLASQQHYLKADARYTADFVKHMRACLELSPKLSTLHQLEFKRSHFDDSIGGFLYNAGRMFTPYKLQDQWIDLQDKYIETVLQNGHYNASFNPLIMRLLLPSLAERGQEARAISLVQELLNHYNAGGAGDFDRMELARMLNTLVFARDKRQVLQLDQLATVTFEDGKAGAVPKMVASGQSIFGLRVAHHDEGGRAFRLPVAGTMAAMVRQLAGLPVLDLACNDRYLMFGTRQKGLFLFDPAALQEQQLSVQNSALPGDTISLACNNGADFLIGINDKDNRYALIYRLEPDTKVITSTAAKQLPILHWRIKAGSGELPIIRQNWDLRTAMDSGKQLTLKVAPTSTPVKDVSVKSDDGVTLLQYRGIELTYVNDFIMWQKHLVFATGNGLYVSKPGTNKVTCILNQPDLMFTSLCAAGDRLALGTSKGIYILDAALFTRAVLDL